MAGKMPTVGQGAGFPAWADTAREQKFLDAIRDARAGVGSARNAGGDAEKLDRAADRIEKARDQLEAGNFERARELTDQANNLIAQATPAPIPAVVSPPPPMPTPEVPTPLVPQPPAAAAPAPTPPAAAAAPDLTAVRAELNAVRAELGKALDLANRAKVVDSNIAKNADPARYMLNTAQEALNQGKPGEANILISTARAEVASIFNKAEAKAGRSGQEAIAARADKLGARVLQDATAPVVQPGTTLPQVIEAIAPAKATNAVRDDIANLRNDSNAARRKGMNTGGDTSRLDAKADRIANRAEKRLAQGDVTGAEQLLKQGERVVSRAEAVASKGGEAQELTLSNITSSYKAATSEGGEGAGAAFLTGLVDRLNPDILTRIAAARGSETTTPERVKGEIAMELDQSGDTSLSAQVTRLYLEQGGYSYVKNPDQKFARTTRVDAKKRDVDSLFTKVVNLVGGKGASDGRETVIHAGDKGKVAGTLFDDTTLVLGKAKGKLDIDLKQGNDTVVSTGVDLKGARIDLGRGRDTAIISGNQLTNVSILGQEGKDSITVVATDAIGVQDGKPAVVRGQITGMKLDAGFDSDTVTVQGNVDRSQILLNDGSDRLTLNADASTADRTVSRTAISAGDGRWNGEDLIAIGGRVRDTQIDLSESWRGHGNDTVLIADSLKGDLAILDDTHSTATWQGKYLKHDDTILLAGDGWAERGEATEKGNAFVRTGADGKVQARVSLGSGEGDGEIEKVMTTTADGGVGTVFRQEQPELFAKPFGVTAGEWGLTLAKAAISTAIPGAAIVFAVGDAVMAASKGDVFGAVLAAAGGVAGGLRVAAAGTTLPGASTYIADAGKAASLAGRLDGFADIITKAAGGAGVVRSAMDGKLSLTDVLSAGSYGLSLAGGANGSQSGLFQIGDGKAGFSLSDARQILDLGNVAAGVIENKGDLSGLAGLLGSRIGSAIAPSVSRAETIKSADAVESGRAEAPYRLESPQAASDLEGDVAQPTAASGLMFGLTDSIPELSGQSATAPAFGLSNPIPELSGRTAPAPVFGLTNSIPELSGQSATAPAFGLSNPIPELSGRTAPAPVFGLTNSIPELSGQAANAPVFGLSNSIPELSGRTTTQVVTLGGPTLTEAGLGESVNSLLMANVGRTGQGTGASTPSLFLDRQFQPDGSILVAGPFDGLVNFGREQLERLGDAARDAGHWAEDNLPSWIGEPAGRAGRWVENATDIPDYYHEGNDSPELYNSDGSASPYAQGYRRGYDENGQAIPNSSVGRAAYEQQQQEAFRREVQVQADRRENAAPLTIGGSQVRIYRTADTTFVYDSAGQVIGEYEGNISSERIFNHNGIRAKLGEPLVPDLGPGANQLTVNVSNGGRTSAVVTGLSADGRTLYRNGRVVWENSTPMTREYIEDRPEIMERLGGAPAPTPRLSMPSVQAQGDVPQYAPLREDYNSGNPFSDLIAENASRASNVLFGLINGSGVAIDRTARNTTNLLADMYNGLPELTLDAGTSFVNSASSLGRFVTRLTQNPEQTLADVGSTLDETRTGFVQFAEQNLTPSAIVRNIGDTTGSVVEAVGTQGRRAVDFYVQQAEERGAANAAGQLLTDGALVFDSANSLFNLVRGGARAPAVIGSSDELIRGAPAHGRPMQNGAPTYQVPGDEITIAPRPSLRQQGVALDPDPAPARPAGQIEGQRSLPGSAAQSGVIELPWLTIDTDAIMIGRGPVDFVNGSAANRFAIERLDDFPVAGRLPAGSGSTPASPASPGGLTVRTTGQPLANLDTRSISMSSSGSLRAPDIPTSGSTGSGRTGVGAAPAGARLGSTPPGAGGAIVPSEPGSIVVSLATGRYGLDGRATSGTFIEATGAGRNDPAATRMQPSSGASTIFQTPGASPAFTPGSFADLEPSGRFSLGPLQLEPSTITPGTVFLDRSIELPFFNAATDAGALAPFLGTGAPVTVDPDTLWNPTTQDLFGLPSGAPIAATQPTPLSAYPDSGPRQLELLPFVRSPGVRFTPPALPADAPLLRPGESPVRNPQQAVQLSIPEVVPFTVGTPLGRQLARGLEQPLPQSSFTVNSSRSEMDTTSIANELRGAGLHVQPRQANQTDRQYGEYLQGLIEANRGTPGAPDLPQSSARGPLSGALRSVRLNLMDRNDFLEAQRDFYIANQAGVARSPALTSLIDDLRLDTQYIQAARQDQRENRPNILQQVGEATRPAREMIGEGLERWSNAVPWAANQAVFNPFVNNVMRPTARFIVRDVLGGIGNAIDRRVVTPAREWLFGKDSAAYNFFHDNPFGNDLRLAARELTLSTSNPVTAPLDRNSLLDQASRFTYEVIRTPDLQRAFVEPAQSTVDLSMAFGGNLATRAQPVVEPMINTASNLVNAAAIGTRLAVTQGLPLALGTSALTGDLQMATRDDVIEMLRLNNYAVSAPYTDPNLLGGVMITTSDDFPVDATFGVGWTGMNFKGYNPEAIAEGDWDAAIEPWNMIPTIFTRTGPNSDVQGAYNAGSRAQLGNLVLMGRIGLPYLQASFNLAAQPGAAGTSMRAEAGDLRAGDNLGVGVLGYNYVAPLRLTGEYNLDFPVLNLPLPSRLVLNSNRFAFEPGRPGDPEEPGNYLLGGQDDLINARLTLGLDPLSLKGTDYPRFQPNDAFYILPQATGSGSNAPVRIGPPTRWPYGSRYDQTYSVPPLQYEAAEALRNDFPALFDIMLPNGQTLFKTPEQISTERAEFALRVLGQNRAEVLTPDNQEALGRILNSLTRGQSESVQDAVTTLIEQPDASEAFEIIQREAPWLLDVKLPDGAPLIPTPPASPSPSSQGGQGTPMSRGPGEVGGTSTIAFADLASSLRGRGGETNYPFL